MLMAFFKCKMCGGTLEIDSNASVAVCEYCGTKQTVPKLDDEKRANLYNRANYFRRNNEFDKAMGIYEIILSEDNTDAEVYWSIVLCRYGVEYVEDPSSHRRVPTVNKAQITSIFDDSDFLKALKYADGYQRDVYGEEAKAIDDIQKTIHEISSKEQPFDVFISYKETDSMGRRTQDSVYAQDIYKALTAEGYRVFFSRITLEDKIGTAYEPYIFAALNSAKVMLVIGTNAENMNAVWVKNEWSRFLEFVKQDNSKTLIPCYCGMNPYDMPEEFAYLQAQDMNRIGFMQDLIRGIQKYISNNKDQQSVHPIGMATSQSLLKRAFLYLSDGDWENATAYLEKVLDIEPENPKAYVGKFLAANHLTQESEIAKTPKRFEVHDLNVQKALSFFSQKEKEAFLADIAKAKEKYDELNFKIEKLYVGTYFSIPTPPAESETAFALFELAAKNGNPLGCLLLGRCYEAGYGVHKPTQIARKLAFQNYYKAVNPEGIYVEEALYEVGKCFLLGIGTKICEEKAVWYLSKSAAMGYPYAEYYLGLVYCSGAGVNKDVQKGIELYYKASEKKIAKAFTTLGNIAFYGQYGFAKNIDEAISKYTEAIHCTDYLPSEACLNLSRCYQQKKDYGQALEILKIGAEKNYADCLNEIGIFHEMGIGVPKNLQQALSWYEASAKKGCGQAIYKLACLYETGTGVPQDIRKAIELFKQAAQKDIGMANYKMGTYACGNKNYALAQQYYERAAKKNIALAYNDLGYLYENGFIGSKSTDDLKRALTNYLTAAKAGNAMAQNNAGCMYYNLYGEYEKAHFWFKKAVDNGYQPAISNLALVIKQEKNIKIINNAIKFQKYF